MRLAAHFGIWHEERRRGRHVRRWQVEASLIYGQVKKIYQRRKLVRVKHVMRLGTAEALTISLQRLGLSVRLNTAFIERVNLTIRHGVAVLVQPPERGDKRMTQRYRQRTPAMAEGRTHRRWTASEHLACPLPQVFA